MTGPLSLLPETLLQTLSDAVGDFTLVGSFARDHLVHDVAGLPRVAQTLDVDIAILVPSMAEYGGRLRHLDGPRGSGLTFRVEGVAVDVIPFGPELTTTGIIEPIPGVTLDVTGMADAAENAEPVKFGHTTVMIPTLASMIGLKLIAWDYRHGSTEKDCRDLGPLLTATFHGPNADALWADGASCERWDYDDMLVGPYRVGLELGRTWSSNAVSRLQGILDLEGIAELATQIDRSRGQQVAMTADQLSALRQGLRDW